MRWLLIVVFILGAVGCGVEVKRISLRDSRLPIDAKRWLADAEDEVAIARARVDDSVSQLKKMKNYRENMEAMLDAGAFTKKSAGAGGEGKKVTEKFARYGEQRVGLKKLELKQAKKVLELAKARLKQARAETAMRHDIAVYELDEISRDVVKLRNEVAKITGETEDQRARVETTADAVWTAYALFVKKGGISNPLWGLSTLKE